MEDAKKEKYVDYAEKSVKLSLILSRIRDEEPSCQLTDEEVLSIAKSNISKFDANPEKVLEGIYKNGHLPLLASRIKDEHTLEFIKNNCNITE